MVIMWTKLTRTFIKLLTDGFVSYENYVIIIQSHLILTLI